MGSKFLVNKSKESYYEKSFVCYIKSNSEIVVPGTDEENSVTYIPAEDDEEFTVKIKFRGLDNAENNSILSETLSLEGDEFKIDVARFSDSRMRAVLKEWNLVDDSDELLLINNKNLNGLNPIISNKIMSVIIDTLGFGIST